MASYPVLALTLAALDATKTDPTGAESADKLDDAIVQTRTWLHDFLARSLSDDGKLLPYALTGDGVVPAGAIRGSNPVGDVQREILQRSIRAIDITASAITANEIADATITAAKILDGTLTSAKLADLLVTTAKLAALGVTTEKLADLSVTTAKLAEASVIRAKIAARAVEGTKLPQAPKGYILVGGNVIDGVTDCLVPRKMGGMYEIDENGIVTPVLSTNPVTNFAVITESATSGSGGGTSLAGAYASRGLGGGGIPPWSKQVDEVGLVNINGHYIEIKVDGVYRIVVSCPACNVNGHKCRVIVKKDALTPDDITANPSSFQTFEGTSEISNVATAQTRSTCEFVTVFSSATDTLFPYLRVEHYTDNATATTGLGKGTGAAGAPEVFAVVSVFRIQ